MQTDFLDAHERHLQDAKMLQKNKRLANADYLYGMSAECGLKSLMLAFGMPFDPDHDWPQEFQDRKHVNEIWQRYEVYRSGHHRGARYTLHTQNPFGDWHVSDRYANRSHFDEERVKRHAEGAKMIRNLVNQARMEGLI